MSEVIRIQHTPDPGSVTEEKYVAPSDRVIDGGQSVTIRNGEIETTEKTVTRGSAQPTAGLPFDARSLAGLPLTLAELTDTSRIYHRGPGGAVMELSVVGAVAAGLIEKGPDGKYQLPAEGAKEAPKEKQPENTTGIFSPELQGFYGEIHAHTKNQAATDAILHETINAASTGDFASAGKALAHFGDIEPVQASAMLEQAVARAAEDVAKAITRSYGVDGKAAVEWASTRPALQRADWMRRVAFGDRSALKEIAEQYKLAAFVKECGSRKK